MTTADNKVQTRSFPINQELFPFQSKWIEIEGINVHYIDEGQGPAIYFFHGNPTWAVLYAPIIQRLKDRYRCIAIDYPGFGFSETPTEDAYGFKPADHSLICGQVVDALTPQNFSVFVQDWGGPIGLDVATKRSDRIQALFVGNTWAWPADLDTEVGRDMQKFSQMMSGQRERILQKNFFVRMSMKQLTMGYKNRAPHLVEAIQDAYTKVHPTPQSRVGMAVFPNQIMASTPWLAELEKRLATIAAKPAVLFWGMQDPLFGDVPRKDWESRLTNSRTVPLPEAGHFFQQDDPDTIAQEVDTLLAQALS